MQVYKSLVGAAFTSNAKLKCEVEAFPHSKTYWIKEEEDIFLNGLVSELKLLISVHLYPTLYWTEAFAPRKKKYHQQFVFIKETN